jgi:hypothetical protein
MKRRLGFGVFMWDGAERRSNRYGSFYPTDTTFGENPDTRVNAFIDQGVLRKLKGKRVKVTAKVVISRKSGHVGDLFLHVYPSQPAVGEEVVLGVGDLDSEIQGGLPAPVLRPGDGRTELWIHPEKLYRLHDQTVTIYVEETDEDYSPAPQLKVDNTGAVGVGNGYIQAKKIEIEDGDKMAPKVERLGDGLFLVGGEYEKGEPVPIRKKGAN